MVGLVSFAVMGSIIATSVSAIEITFKRYSQTGCDATTDHIAADTHLHNPYCKSFDTDEPAFYSFVVVPEDDEDDLVNRYCFATVYDGKDCQGEAFTYGDMNTYVDRCADSTIPGRSVRISCEDSSTTVTGTMPASTVTQHIQIIGTTTAQPTTTITLASAPTTTLALASQPTTTLTLVPASDDDDADWW